MRNDRKIEKRAVIMCVARQMMMDNFNPLPFRLGHKSGCRVDLAEDLAEDW